MGKTSPAVLRWEPSELKKERILFFAAGDGGSVPSPQMWGSPAARGYFAFFEGGGKKKKGENGEKMKKSIEKGEKKHKKSCVTPQCVV